MSYGHAHSEPAAPAAGAHAHEGDHGPGGHITPVSLLLKVWVALMVLTVLTVAVTYVNLGSLNLTVALVIAIVKATVVALYFMHLRWDRGLNTVVLLTAIAFVLLFIGFAIMDSLGYRENLVGGQAPGVQPMD